MSDAITLDVSQDERADESQQDGHARKRRRSLRKGTHSCWACKRRKEKCSYKDGSVCTGCLRRGTRCVSQRFIEEEATPATAATATATRLQRIEDMVAQLTSQIQSQTHDHIQGQSLSQTVPPVSAAYSASSVLVAVKEPIASPSSTMSNIERL
jgi:hypothetical protein